MQSSAVQMFPTVPACGGCAKEQKLGNALGRCMIYAIPRARQRLLGGCPAQTNRQKVVVIEKKVNALKASKRAAAGK